jgi:hypothetical protein
MAKNINGNKKYPIALSFCSRYSKNNHSGVNNNTQVSPSGNAAGVLKKKMRRQNSQTHPCFMGCAIACIRSYTVNPMKNTFVGTV